MLVDSSATKSEKKHYIVDGHEQPPEMIVYYPVLTKTFLAYEVRAHQWIQVALEESNSLVLNDIITASGFGYKTE